MNSRYYYLELDVDKLGNAEQPALAAQSLLQHVGRELFGEVGVPHADILRADGSRVLVRVQSQSLRKFRAAIALSPQRIHVCNQAPSLSGTQVESAGGAGGADGAGRTVWRSGAHTVVLGAREELARPSAVSLAPPEPAPGLILPDGSINWGCPCLGGMATGPCGPQFRDAFSCFHYSEAEPKGSDCYEKFSVMQECMSQFPELYGKDDDDDELAAAMEQAGDGAPNAPPAPPAAPTDTAAPA